MAQKSKNKHGKSNNNRQIIIASVLALMVLAAIIVAVVLGTEKQPKTQYAAIVNGEKIEMAYVDRMYNTIDPIVRMELTKLDFLNLSIIPDVLLYQEVQKAGITATDEEVQADIENTLFSFGLTKEELDSQLAEVNSSYSEFESMTKRKLETLKYVNENFIPPAVTEDEAIAFYHENEEAFKYNLGENVTYELVAEGIKTGIGIETQKAMVMEKVDELRKTAKILVNNALLQS